MNIQPNVESALRETVSRYLADYVPFTSVDIVNDVRSEGYFLRHGDAAEWLRRNVIQLSYEQGALYNQTLIEVNSERDGLTRAYLYHHMNDNPDSYQNRGTAPSVSPFTAALAAVGVQAYQSRNNTPVSTGGAHHSNFQKRDRYGRFV